LNTTSEKERLIKFIKAAIERRVYEVKVLTFNT
jgi:hypothetical protein